MKKLLVTVLMVSALILYILNSNNSNDVNSVNFVSLGIFESNNFWSTYGTVFVITSIVLVIAFVVYLMIVIANDLEFGDLTDFIGEIFEDWAWFIMISAIFGGGSLFWIFPSETYLLIILGGIAAFILLALVIHFIKFIIVDRHYYQDYVDDADYEDYEDYEDDEDYEDYEDDEDDGRNYKRSLNKNSKKIKSSGILLKDIAGLDEAKEAFNEKIVLPFTNKELFEKYGKKAGGGILLYGLPGTGKTMFAEAASNELDALFIPIKCSDVKSKWYGQSENKVKSIFQKARNAKRAIIFFDEFEAIGAKRTDSSENGNNDLVPQILAEMQGIGNSKTDSIIMVIAATNKPWAIDSAFLRPGRFDEKIYIPLPDFKSRKKLFELKLKDIPTNNLDMNYLSRITENFNGADINEVCEKLKMLAIKKSIENKKEHVIGMDDVKAIEKTLKTSVSPEDIERLMTFEKCLD